MKRLILTLAVALIAVAGYSSTRLMYDLGGTPGPVYWASSSFPVHYTIDRRVAAIADGQRQIDRAFAAWTAVSDAAVTFQSDGIADNMQAGQNGHNSISMTDNLFANQNFIALTTHWYDDRSGLMTEADIQLDPMASGNGYNLQQLVEHEVGHVLGLDHSAVISSVMYPYVGRGGPSDLDSDDRVAIASMYPKTDVTALGATLRGKVMGNDGAIFAAQVVAVNAAGEPVATSLTNALGEFEIQAIPSGNYRIYAEPLDGPVEVRNFSGMYRTAKVVSFPTEFMAGGAIHVDSGKLYGNLVVNSTGAPVTLNPKWVGVFPPSSTDVALSATSVAVNPGQTVSIAVAGDGFTSGMTTFDVLNPAFKRISDYRYAANYVYATYTVATNAEATSNVIMVKNGNDSAALTGAVRVQSVPRLRVARK
jgi:hypothetical protein